MKTRLFACFVVLFFLFSAQAQLTDDQEGIGSLPGVGTSTTNTAQGINSDNFAAIEQDISDWTALSSQSIPTFTSAFSFTNDNFADELKKIASRTVNDKEIVDTELSIRKTTLYIEENNRFINILKADKSKANTAQKQIASTLVIVANPHNQLNLTKDEISQLPQLSEQLLTLQQNIDSHIITVQKNNELANADLKLAKDYLTELKNQSQKQLTQASLDNIQDEKKRFQDQQLDYESKINEIRIKLGPTGQAIDLTQRRLLNDELLYLQELAWLLRIDENLTENYNKLGLMLGHQENLTNDTIKNLSNGYQAIQEALDGLNQQKTLLEGRQNSYASRVDADLPKYDLTEAFTERAKNIDAQISELQNALPELSKLLADKRKASLYRTDPLFKLANLKTGFNEITKSPAFFYYQIKISLVSLWQGFLQKVPLYLFLAVVLFAIFFVLNKWLKTYLLKHNEDNSDAVFFYQNAQKLVEFIQLGFFKYGILLFFALLIFLTNIATPSKEILYSWVALLAALIYWFDIINISLEKHSISKEFYLRLKILGALINVSILLFLMAKFSLANEYVTAIYEKIVFLLVIVFYLNYNKFLILYFKKRQTTEEAFFQKSFRVYVRIIPWVFILCAFFGLIGYSKLAWLVAFRLAVFFTFVLILFIGYGLLNDFRKILKIKAFKKYKLGAFIAQDIVSPVISIAKILWTLITIGVFLRITIWDGGEYYLGVLKDIVNYPLLELMGIKVTIASLVLTVVSIYLIMKVSRWFRSVSYRWLYARISDLGVRNSVSVFTQYFIVAIGFLVTLNIIGIDLTTLTVFAGALGVGIGLGLQDVAKNFISGILLLIERPLQTGDTVTINNIEGTVNRIGMRSLTLETFNSEEVIIPNAAVISDAFTNWTYSNSTLRTVLYIGASYDAPPEKVISVLEKIIADNTDVLSTPNPKVVLWEYADSSINYRFQFYIDMDKSSLLDVRTALLTEIWHRFKDNDIEIPFPQRDLHIKTPGKLLS